MVKQLSLRQLSFDMLFTSQETVVFSKYFGRLTQLSVGRLTSLQAYQRHVTQAGEGFVGTPVWYLGSGQVSTDGCIFEFPINPVFLMVQYSHILCWTLMGCVLFIFTDDNIVCRQQSTRLHRDAYIPSDILRQRPHQGHIVRPTRGTTLHCFGQWSLHHMYR